MERSAPTTATFGVSVVVPVFEAEAYLDEAVRSILDQPEVVELLLVEDGGRDTSLRICEAWAQRDDRVRVLQHPEGINRGVSATRNLGIRSATAPFVAFLDADDVCLPHRFRTDVAVFAREPDAEGCYHAIGATFQDATGRSLYEQRFDDGLTTMRMPFPPDRLFHALSGGVLDAGHFSLDGLTIRRDALLRMPNLLREDMAMHEDTEFIVRLSYHCKLYPGSLKEPVALRRVHAENRITRNDRLAGTRAALFAHLLRWAREVGAPVDAQRRFALEAEHYDIRMAAGEGLAGKALRLLLAHPRQFKRPDSLHA
ncbi:MAG: glycosyltransferase, partial [Flavobacteriales bacterium]|nr:glycosyltransferase [Flavobacteriales bacterium]